MSKYVGVHEVLIANSYGNYKGFFLSKTDLLTLKGWLTSSVIPFKGFQGKVLFQKELKFPRYKFTQYSREVNTLVRRVKSISNADAIVMDVEYYMSLLEKCEKNMESYNASFKEDPKGVNVGFLESHFLRFLNSIQILEQLYKDIKNLKIISAFDLNAILGQEYSTIDKIKLEQLSKLFNSGTPENVKLAMEIMTNCDFEPSLFYICLLFNKYGELIRRNQYWYSTSFSAFRNALDKTELAYENFHRFETMQVVEKFLLLPNKFILESDVDYIKHLVQEEIKNKYNMEDTGFELTISDIKLNLDPSKIIKVVNSETNDEDSEITEEESVETSV